MKGDATGVLGVRNWMAGAQSCSTTISKWAGMKFLLKVSHLSCLMRANAAVGQSKDVL